MKTIGWLNIQHLMSKSSINNKKTRINFNFFTVCWNFGKYLAIQLQTLVIQLHKQEMDFFFINFVLFFFYFAVHLGKLMFFDSWKCFSNEFLPFGSFEITSKSYWWKNKVKREIKWNWKLMTIKDLLITLIKVIST